MLFNSFEYLIFYSVFFMIFFILKSVKWQILFICMSSLYFYGSWSPVHVALLLITCTISFSVHFNLVRRYTPLLQIISLLSILFVFKYYNFFVENISNVAIKIRYTDLILPVGISFYVFQSISFVVDHERQHISKISFSETLAYISFFPQLVAGPIVRASVFLPQLKKARKFNKYMFYTGLLLFFMGLFKKTVIADNVGLFVDKVYVSPGATSAGNHILAFYLYAIQIYYDFCGYSEMAIGVARTLGFKFTRNFARPYSSSSITEFWKRWHISLSSWLRDYLYIPLGGNKHGHIRTYLNLAIVMLLGGLWHGAAWTFVAWGGLHGLMLAIERKIKYAHKNHYSKYLGQFITFQIVCISWVFFRSPDFSSALNFFNGMTDFSSITIITAKFLAVKCVVLMFIFVFIEYFSTRNTFFHLRRKACLLPIIIVYINIFILWGNFKESPFIYFQF